MGDGASQRYPGFKQNLGLWDEIWHMDSPSMLRLVNFGPRGPLGRQNTEGCKIFWNAFLVHRLAERQGFIYTP